MPPSPDPDISIIIPVFNESKNLERCLNSIPNSKAIEILISDGGSTDNSLEIAQTFDVKILHSEKGRAQQMNKAAAAASGTTLLFLHADTILPNNAISSIQQAIHQGFSMGCFERIFDTKHFLLRHTSRWAGWRAKHFFLAYGDQAIFIQRQLFETLNGYQNMPRFEDLDLTLRAKKHGSWTLLPGPIITNARRFGKSPLKRILKDAGLTIAWLLGIIR